MESVFEIKKVVKETFVVGDKVFATRKEAEEYAMEDCGLKMWDRDGNLVTCAYDTYFLYLGNQKSTEFFIYLCKRGFYNYDGIDSESIGYFYYDDSSNRFMPISEKDIKKIKDMSVIIPNPAFTAIKFAIISQRENED